MDICDHCPDIYTRFLNPVLDNKLDNIFDSGENGYKIQYVLDFTGF